MFGISSLSPQSDTEGIECSTLQVWQCFLWILLCCQSRQMVMPIHLIGITINSSAFILVYFWFCYMWKCGIRNRLERALQISMALQAFSSYAMIQKYRFWKIMLMNGVSFFYSDSLRTNGSFIRSLWENASVGSEPVATNAPFLSLATALSIRKIVKRKETFVTRVPPRELTPSTVKRLRLACSMNSQQSTILLIHKQQLQTPEG